MHLINVRVINSQTDYISNELIKNTMAFTDATFVVFFAVTALTQGKLKGITYY